MAYGWLYFGDDPVVTRYWPQAADEATETVTALLASSREQCEAYAPALADDVRIPNSWVHAQVLQARALYRSMIAGDSNGVGADGFTVTVFPMDWTVKALLRPKRGPWAK